MVNVPAWQKKVVTIQHCTVPENDTSLPLLHLLKQMTSQGEGLVKNIDSLQCIKVMHCAVQMPFEISVLIEPLPYFLALMKIKT